MNVLRSSQRKPEMANPLPVDNVTYAPDATEAPGAGALDASALAGMTYTSAALHLLAELTGSDLGGYWDMQSFALFGHYATCASPQLQLATRHLQWVLLPPRLPSNSTSNLRFVLGAVVLLLAGLFFHGLLVAIAALVAKVTGLADDGEDDDAATDAATTTADTERREKTPDALELAQTWVRYPGLSFVWVRLVFLYCIFAAVQGFSAPGAGAGEGVLGSAIVVMMLVLLFLKWRAVSFMGLLWLRYKHILAEFVEERPGIARMLLPSGIWYDETASAKQFVAVVAATRWQHPFFFLLWRPALLLLEGIFAGIDFNRLAPSACAAQFAVPCAFSVINVAAHVIVPPLRHPMANATAALRCFALFLFLLSQTHATLQRDLEAPAVVFLVTTHFVSGLINLALGVAEMLLWAPGEYEARWEQHGEDWELKESEHVEEIAEQEAEELAARQESGTAAASGDATAGGAGPALVVPPRPGTEASAGTAAARAAVPDATPQRANPLPDRSGAGPDNSTGAMAGASTGAPEASPPPVSPPPTSPPPVSPIAPAPAPAPPTPTPGAAVHASMLSPSEQRLQADLRQREEEIRALKEQLRRSESQSSIGSAAAQAPAHRDPLASPGSPPTLPRRESAIRTIKFDIKSLQIV